MAYSDRERIAHAMRRLGVGGHPDLTAAAISPADAVGRALDLTAPAPRPPRIAPPDTADPATQRGLLRDGIEFWIDAMRSDSRLIEERLIWFWHDYFATSVRKVRFPYLMWAQHLTLRRHATGSFADLLHAIAVDPAMLLYLDGAQNRAGAINENFGREVMELYTVGAGTYTQQDVVAAARAFSGWVVAVPRDGRPIFADPWSAVFVSARHDGATKSLLGVDGNLDTTAAIDILLDHPATAGSVAAALYRHLTGLEPDGTRLASLAAVLRADYSIMALVESIVEDAAFLSDDAIRSRVRSPLEKVITIWQGFPVHERAFEWASRVLDAAAYLPFQPPNPAGFPNGMRLLDPYRLVHGFDFAGLVDPRLLDDLPVDALFARLGVHDVSPATHAVLEGEPGMVERLALAVNSPEFLVT